MLEFSLSAGAELDQDKIDEISKQSQFYQVKAKFINWLSLRQRSEKEVKDYLKRKDVLPELHDKFIDLSTKLGNSDNEFALSRARHRRQQFKSDRMIRFELQSQGMEPEQISQAIADLEHDEAWAIKQLLNGRLAIKPTEKAREYLIRQGFNYELVKNTIAAGD